MDIIIMFTCMIVVTGIFVIVCHLNTIIDILRINHTIPNDDFDKIEELKKKLLHEIESLKLTSGVFKKK